MMKVVGLALALAVGATGFALAKDADDEKVPAAEVTKIEETLSTLAERASARAPQSQEK